MRPPSIHGGKKKGGGPDMMGASVSLDGVTHPPYAAEEEHKSAGGITGDWGKKEAHLHCILGDVC